MTQRHFLLLLCVVALPAFVHSQTLQGIVENEKGEPVSNASIYISEISRGIVANDKGQFQTDVKPGIYHCEFRSLGYESKTMEVSVAAAGTILHVTLDEKIYELKEVVVSSSDEDPAYRIMRKVIAYAPFYRNQVSEYQSQTYTKGTFRIDKIPGIIKKMSRMNGEKVDFDALTGKTFVMESDNEITFRAPNSYQQRVKAAKSSIPKEFDMGEDALKVVTENIYDESLFKPGAFRYYKFKWEDVETDNGRTINKIRVTPRYRNAELYSGYLYILENTWNVFEADLSASELGSTIHYRITFHEVKPSVYLPTTYDMNLAVNTMGIKGGGRYFVSIAYRSVTVRQEKIPSSVAGISDPANSQSPLPESGKVAGKKKKSMEKMEKLAAKEDLSTREAYQLSQLMREASESEEEGKNRASLEIKEHDNIKIKIDSLAFRIDSSYWNKVRVLPLEKPEALSYSIADSINPPDSTRKLRKGSRSISLAMDEGPESTAGKLMMGGVVKLNKKSHLRLGGIAYALNGYNFVDGFSLGQSLQYRLNVDSARFLQIKPDVRYVTARKTVRWTTDVQWDYRPMRQGRAQLSFGHVSEDLNRSYGMNRFLNGMTAAMYGGSYIRFYDRAFIVAANRIDLANGLNLTTSLSYEKRAVLRNLTTYNLAGKKVGENMPADWYASFAGHRASITGLRLSYTPFYRYRIVDGRKNYVSSVYPTFTATYKKGIGLPESFTTSRFDLLEASVSQGVKTSVFSQFKYFAGGGRFLTNSSLLLPDYRYFRQNPMLVGDKSFDFSFNMLPEYTSARHYWGELHASYTSEYLLLKKLPFLQGQIFDEALHFHYLHADGRLDHFEGGYSVGLGDVGRMGVFTAFDGKKYKGVSVKISLPLFSIMGMR